MTKLEQAKQMEMDAAALRAEIEWRETYEQDGEAVHFDESECDRLNDEAWRLEDAAAVIRAEVALECPAFAALVAHSLPTMPAGPTNLGDPGVWHNGREYWAYEVVELAEKISLTRAA